MDESATEAASHSPAFLAQVDPPGFRRSRNQRRPPSRVRSRL